MTMALTREFKKVGRCCSATVQGRRATTSLARLLASDGRGGEASPQLTEILGRFTEGLETFDVRQARRVPGDLG
jgi:hypothetical protein